MVGAIETDVECVAPSMSVTVKRTTKVAVVVNVRENVGVVAACCTLSTYHAYVSGVPSGSDEPEPLNVTASGLGPAAGLGDVVRTAVGALLTIVNVWVCWRVPPLSSVTVKVMDRDPARAVFGQVNDAFGPLAVRPSFVVQEYATTVPSTSLEAPAFTSTVIGRCPSGLLCVNV